MSNIIDLNILFPEPDVVSFKAKNEEVYNIKVEISNEIALKFIKMTKEEVSENEIATILVKELINCQYEKEIDEDYVNKNVPWKYIVFISKKIRDEIHSSLDIIEGSTGDNAQPKK